MAVPVKISNAVPAAKHKPIASEDWGNITGRRGAGMTTICGGNQLLHSLNYYGKDEPAMPDAMTGAMPGRRFMGGIF